MPREPRIYIESVLYFITARGDEDRHLFNDSQDFSEYLKPLSEYKQEYGFKLYAFALLPKRLCLLIELRNDVTISTIMHNLNSRYTKIYNARYDKKGHLFQSRFKSILVEKNEYLLKLSRYIHLLPKDSGVTENPVEYPYSSYSSYVSDKMCSSDNAQMPHMADEIKEVLSYLTEAGAEADKRKAYERYIQSADDEEMKIVRKLLHRTAFVGSKDFTRKIKNRIAYHIAEEERSRIVRKTNPVFVLTGGMVIIFLGFVTYNLYNSQSSLQNTLNATANSFEVAREDLAKHVSALQNKIIGFEEKENHGLGGLAWEVQLAPVREGEKGDSYIDHLHFKDGQVVSADLIERGFSPFDYSMTPQSHGKMIWQTTQTNKEGLTVRWYGIVTGNKMRGVLSERPACRQAGRFQCENRDFSFVSVKRVKNTGRVQNVVQ